MVFLSIFIYSLEVSYLYRPRSWMQYTWVYNNGKFNIWGHVCCLSFCCMCVKWERGNGIVCNVVSFYIFYLFVSSWIIFTIMLCMCFSSSLELIKLCETREDSSNFSLKISEYQSLLCVRHMGFYWLRSIPLCNLIINCMCLKLKKGCMKAQYFSRKHKLSVTYSVSLI